MTAPAVPRPRPPAAGVYVVIRGHLAERGDGRAVLSYGDGAELAVDTRQPGVFVIPDVAARALAVCLPA